MIQKDQPERDSPEKVEAHVALALNRRGHVLLAPLVKRDWPLRLRNSSPVDAA
jgi:hypothetical protein